MHDRQATGRTSSASKIPIASLVAACFFFSGVAGLIYEVVWARQLALFLGITSYAHTAVITAYMAGLAAGSFYFGRRSDRMQQPLIVYAWLEIGVGVYAAITPWLFDALQVAYVSSVDVSSIGTMSGHLARFVIALIALLLPTFLMGGTLPLLVRGFTSGLPDFERTTGRFYGLNTVGAMAGTIIAGFWLLPAFGVTPAILVGVTINLVIAAIILGLPRESLPQRRSTEQSAPPDRQLQEPAARLSAGARGTVLLAFAVAGFAALLTQMAWIRALILVVGGSVYAFTITLASFLAGIGLGSLLYSRYLARSMTRRLPAVLQDRPAQAALLALLISLTLLLGLPLIGKLPGLFLAGYAAGLSDSFALFQLFIFALCFGVMILPTLMMGAMFPLVTAIWTTDAEKAGRGVGAAYAINTGGTILGALSGGLFILPWLGIHSSVLLAACLYLIVAMGFWLIAGTGINRTRQFAIAGVATVAVAIAGFLIPPWDRAVMVSGAFSRPALINSILQRQPDKSLKQIVDDYELLYYDEGPEATVAVRRKKGSDDNQRTLVINGKADASSAGDMPTQILLAQLPMAFRPGAEDALVIGLGSGITAGSLSTSKALKNITILEISDEVIEASAFFAPENYDVLDDPRVHLATADARNYLMAAPQRYDLIISEPSNPWLSGIANLFTDEFLQLAKSRLKPGGIMTQWFHIYSMSDEDLKTMLKTFDDNFEYVSVWRIQVGDLALIGSDEPHALSLRHAAGSGASELARGDIHSDRDLVGTYIFGGERLSRYVADASINSDRTPIVEFSAPKNLYSSTADRNIGNIVDYLQGMQQAVPAIDMVWRTADYLHAPFMSLRIAGSAEDAVQVNARWLIDRRKVQVNGGFTDGLGSERLLSWTEGDSRYQVRAVLIADATQAPSLDDLLQQLIRSTGRQGGKTALDDGSDAIWLSNAAAGRTRLQLDVAWDCAGDDSEFSRYGLQATLVDPGSEAPATHVARLARRFSCEPTPPVRPPAD